MSIKKTFEKHFRIYLVSGHPAYIIDEEGNYYFHRVTSSPKSGHHKNWKVEPNPDSKRETPMYIIKTNKKTKRIVLVKSLNTISS